MRYWPITATHVYWYRRIRAARLSPHLFLSRGVFLSTGFLRRRTVSGILMERCLILVTYFPSFDFSARRPVGGGRETRFVSLIFPREGTYRFQDSWKEKNCLRIMDGCSNFWDDDRSFLSFFLGVKVFSTKTPERIWRVTPSPSQFSPFSDLVINGFRELGSLRSSRNYEETTPSPSRLTCRKRWPCTKLTTYIISERCVAIFALPSPSNSIFPIFTIDSFGNNFEEIIILDTIGKCIKFLVLVAWNI